MNKVQEVIELSGLQFSVLVLLSGVFSPLLFVVSWILEVFGWL